MIQLALLRHAKSSWDEPGIDDFDRPLNTRGRAAAPVMGQILASLKFQPDVVLCSPSVRTRETLACVKPHFEKKGAAQIKLIDQLYLASPADLMEHISSVASDAKRVLVIGHNPGLQMLASKLAASGDPAQLIRLNEKFPTAALALLSFPSDTFANMDIQSGHLEAFITPKDRT
ncbi:MAG: histidine phosphatase family protein [Hyphomicrobium sp.]|jgi:phosphohistidine phosphatase